MNILNIFRILGLLVMGFSPSMLLPIIIALLYMESTLSIFLWSLFISLGFGLLLWLPTRKYAREIKPREGFLIVTLLWILLSLIASLPFMFSTSPELSVMDAFFETVSGLTTTGATVFVGLDSMPRSILFYRQQLQFIGGGGIILLGIAIMPMLGVGGMQLFKAEIPGPFKEEKLTPRIAQAAKTLWFIYVGLVLLCTLSYWSAGMDFFDAISHSFSTVSTGGFSTHDKSIAYYNGPAIRLVATFFMILGAINFSLHFTALYKGSFAQYWQDSECRAYLILILISSILVSATLFHFKLSSTSYSGSIIESFFQATTFFTTTGFFSADYNSWPSFILIFLTLLGLVGGCAGSTAGGIKIIRVLLMNKQGFREIQRLIHPNGHYVIKIGRSRLHPQTLDAIWGFLWVYIAAFALLLIALMIYELDLLTAFSVLCASISNTGIGIGAVADNFKSLSDPVKFISCLAMLLGRLEFFSVLVLLAPSYWRN